MVCSGIRINKRIFYEGRLIEFFESLSEMKIEKFLLD